ncbi:MAG: tetratricopeptide repeat protein [Vicinamibacteria bacterium]
MSDRPVEDATDEAVAARLAQARLLVVRGEPEAALALVERVLDEDPGRLPALILQGTLLLHEREEARALAAFERAVALAPGSAEGRNGQARVLHALGRHAEALAAAQAALAMLSQGENFRETSAVYLTLVWCLREQHRYREALALAEEGLLRAPDAVLAQWASVVEEEAAEAEKERC